MDAEIATAWRNSQADPFPFNTLLRDYGWRLAERPKGSESTWTRDGVTCPQSQALDILLLQFGWERQKLAWRWRHPSWGLVDRAEALQTLLDWHNGMDADTKRLRKKGR